MKEKLTKEELLEQLAEIEKREKLDREENFYNTYKDLTFFQIWKKITNWISLIFITSLIEIICLFDTKTSWFIVFGFPLLMLFFTSTRVLEVQQRIKYIKKKKIIFTQKIKKLKAD